MSKQSNEQPVARVALVSCAELPGGDADDAGLVAALAEVGIDAEWEVWDDPAVLWQRYSAVVIRSTWDYTARRSEFLRWGSGVAARGPMVQNPTDLLSWNSDKSYLRELAENGVAVVPTTWCPPGIDPTWPDVQFVVKPSVGAGSMGAGRFDPSDAASLTAAGNQVTMLQAAGRTAMIQPYLNEVDVAGERALVYFNGRFSHAVTKAALLAPNAANPLREGASSAGRSPLYIAETITPATASEAELATGAQVLAGLRERGGGYPLYARVDLLPTPDGPVLIELELVEPSLFFTHGPDALTAFAAALASRLSPNVGSA